HRQLVVVRRAGVGVRPSAAHRAVGIAFDPGVGQLPSGRHHRPVRVLYACRTVLCHAFKGSDFR
nr:hypothetical protein [Tanacetum cinerariifolium]